MSRYSIKRQCEACGAEFLTNNYNIQRGNGRFCSRACYQSARKITYVDLVCAICEQPYQIELGQYNSRIKQQHPVKYCSVQCAGKSAERNKNLSASLKQSEALKASRTITIPKAKATKNTPEHRAHMRAKMQEQMADPEKRARWAKGIQQRSNNPKWRDAPTHLRGEANPNYTGSASERETAMGRKEYKDWRKAVFMRDSYTCQRCNKRGGRCVAHHIKPWAAFPEIRYDVSNGETLCEQCHDLEHGKIKKPKTYRCQVCGKSKKDGRSPRCLECGRKHLPLPK